MAQFLFAQFLFAQFLLARYLLASLLLAGVFLGCSPGGSSSGRSYPSKTVTLICPWAPGGGTDRVARFWADALQRELGRPFVVVNRTGGSGAVGHAAGANAAADGHTLTMITFELSTMHHMGISPLTFRDFGCLIQMNADPAAIVVRQDAPWAGLPEFLEEVRQQPGQRKMSGTARGGAWDLARAGLLWTAGLPVDAIRWVPNEGAAPSLIELLGGHIDAVCCSVPEAASQVESGQLRVLAVMDEKRLPQFPDIPTTWEAGIEWAAVGWRGLAVPKQTPDEIVRQLEAKCLEIAASQRFDSFMEQNRFGVVVRSSAEFQEFLAEQDEQWRPVIEAAGYAK